jgi:hypothetical protein
LYEQELQYINELKDYGIGHSEIKKMKKIVLKIHQKRKRSDSEKQQLEKS